MVPEDPNPPTKNAPIGNTNNPEDTKGSVSSRKSSDGERITKLRRPTVKRSVVYAKSSPDKSSIPAKKNRHDSIKKAKRGSIKSEKRPTNVTTITNNEASVTAKRNKAKARKTTNFLTNFPFGSIVSANANHVDPQSFSKANQHQLYTA